MNVEWIQYQAQYMSKVKDIRFAVEMVMIEQVLVGVQMKEVMAIINNLDDVNGIGPKSNSSHRSKIPDNWSPPK